jgi:hypothetical protein
LGTTSAYFSQSQGERSKLHEHLLNERAGYVVQVYEHNVARLVNDAIGNAARDYPLEVVRIVYRDPPRPVAWYHRLFGG